MLLNHPIFRKHPMKDTQKRQCGAKNRQGEPCKKPPLKGKARCKLHGGKSAGGKNSKTYTHGIYSSVLTANELEMQDSLSSRLSSVDDEINLVRVRILRAQKAENEALLNATLEIEEVKSVTGGDFASTTTTSRKTDYAGIIDKAMGRLGQLMRVRMELMVAKGEGEFSGVPADETLNKARRIREALDSMDQAVTEVPVADPDSPQ